MQQTNNFTVPALLNASEEKFLHLTRLMPVAVYCTDKDGIITFYNEQAAELWGRYPNLNDPGEIRFCGAIKLYQPDGTVMLHADSPMGTALKYSKSFRDEEICMERPDGKKLFLLINIDLLFDNEGILNGAINVFQNVTEYKRTSENTMKLAAIVESSDDAIISKSLTGIITSWNKGAERIFGYMENEIISKPINILIPASHQEEEKHILEKIRNGEKVEHFETIRLTKNGTELNISLTVSPVRNEKGDIIGASNISRDVTEKVKTENQLRIYAEKLRELNNYKDEFMALASHELKTPLTVIKANLGLMELKFAEHISQEFISRTMTQVNKLSDLISDLLDISKVQAGSLQLNFTAFNLVQLLHETVENIQQTSPTHTIILEVVDDNLPVIADWPRFEQVIVNVLTNAVKYSPASDKVIVNATCKNEIITISIKDFGIGIPRQHLKKIFSRFFRVQETSAAFLGSGIGLYISNEIVKRHKGKMWVTSEEDKGSTFYFTIPSA